MMGEVEMDEPELVVKHLIACGRIEVEATAPDALYSLFDVGYRFDLPGDQEWPVRLNEFWLYARFYSGRGSRSFGLSVAWVDSPNGIEEEFAYFELSVVFPSEFEVLGRAWN